MAKSESMATVSHATGEELRPNVLDVPWAADGTMSLKLFTEAWNNMGTNRLNGNGRTCRP